MRRGARRAHPGLWSWTDDGRAWALAVGGNSKLIEKMYVSLERGGSAARSNFQYGGNYRGQPAHGNLDAEIAELGFDALDPVIRCYRETI